MFTQQWNEESGMVVINNEAGKVILAFPVSFVGQRMVNELYSHLWSISVAMSDPDILGSEQAFREKAKAAQIQVQWALTFAPTSVEMCV